MERRAARPAIRCTRCGGSSALFRHFARSDACRFRCGATRLLRLRGRPPLRAPARAEGRAHGAARRSTSGSTTSGSLSTSSTAAPSSSPPACRRAIRCAAGAAPTSGPNGCASSSRAAEPAPAQRADRRSRAKLAAEHEPASDYKHGRRADARATSPTATFFRPTSRRPGARSFPRIRSASCSTTQLRTANPAHLRRIHRHARPARRLDLAGRLSALDDGAVETRPIKGTRAALVRSGGGPRASPKSFSRARRTAPRTS